LLERDPAWLAAVEFVAIDPAGPYRSAVRAVLLHTVIVVDHFHFVRPRHAQLVHGK